MDRSSLRILLVEDSRVYQRLVRRCLGDTYEIVAESSAEAAEERLVDASYDLFLVDWGLSQRTGLAFIRTLRRSDHFRDQPIILLTSKNRSRDVRQAARVGIDDYIVKPASCAVLREKVAASLDANRGSSNT